MKEYNAIIIDDEKNIREALSILLGQYCPEIHVCGIAGSAAEGRHLIENNSVDFIFLDISMPKEDGFAFLRSIPGKNFGIIFATAYEEYALRALKANAVDYLLKPINPYELQEAVKKLIFDHELRRNYSQNQEVYRQSLLNLDDNIQSRTDKITKLTVSDQSGFRVVNIDDLIYLEGSDNYTVFHLQTGQQIISTRPLNEFEKILEGTEFFRIHKSTILNINFLAGYSNSQGNFAILNDGTQLLISRRKILEFRDKVKQYSITID
ncbi:MAG: LytR/AlgR family response regulator transcription factor [Bacteroidales bacterium]